MEQMRIVREMRAADQKRGRFGVDIRPRWMCWENVPGAFSSGTPKYEDFRIVLEEIVRISFPDEVVPSPYPGSWPDAGELRAGDDFSLAWRCLDAQYWGVAQRRKRIFSLLTSLDYLHRSSYLMFWRGGGHLSVSLRHKRADDNARDGSARKDAESQKRRPQKPDSELVSIPYFI